MKKLLLIGCFVFLGCETPEESSRRQVNSNLDTLSGQLEYYKDTRVNLCYSGMYIGYQYGTLTNVPCTPEVEKIAHQFQSNPTVR